MTTIFTKTAHLRLALTLVSMVGGLLNEPVSNGSSIGAEVPDPPFDDLGF